MILCVCVGGGGGCRGKQITRTKLVCETLTGIYALPQIFPYLHALPVYQAQQWFLRLPLASTPCPRVQKLLYALHVYRNLLGTVARACNKQYDDNIPHLALLPCAVQEALVLLLSDDLVCPCRQTAGKQTPFIT